MTILSNAWQYQEILDNIWQYLNIKNNQNLKKIERWNSYLNNIEQYWIRLYNIAQYSTILHNIRQYLAISENILQYCSISRNIWSHFMQQKQSYAIPNFSFHYFFFYTGEFWRSFRSQKNGKIWDKFPFRLDIYSDIFEFQTLDRIQKFLKSRTY